MGPSGSGKTTLLDLLAGRKTVGKTEGKVLFAGNVPSRNFLRRYTGYVEQFGKRKDPWTAPHFTIMLGLGKYIGHLIAGVAGYVCNHHGAAVLHR
jgi:ABC-type nitrate/sulfonate/bicarbonate transport system ATPase subunit